MARVPRCLAPQSILILIHNMLFIPTCHIIPAPPTPLLTAILPCHQSVFDTLLPTSEVWVQVEQLYTLFGQALVSQAPYLSLTVFLTLFMPRYRDHFLAHRPNAEKYHSFLRMFHAFTNHDNTSFR